MRENRIVKWNLGFGIQCLRNRIDLILQSIGIGEVFQNRTQVDFIFGRSVCFIYKNYWGYCKKNKKKKKLLRESVQSFLLKLDFNRIFWWSDEFQEAA